MSLSLVLGLIGFGLTIGSKGRSDAGEEAAVKKNYRRHNIMPLTINALVAAF